jgi:phosphatidylinositol-binding clathrin assembly protein
MQHYAIYLDARIRAYRDLKHDAIAVQSEANRDFRMSLNVDAEQGRSQRPTKPAASSGVQRSKTLAGRKLRVMTVEKGLLRETKAVQKQIDTLVECRVSLNYSYRPFGPG